MTQEQIKFKQISAKLVGSNVVNFRLEDGTLLKVYVDIGRIGVAVDRKNPDGTPLYNANVNVRLDFQTKEGTFYAPPPPAPTQNIADKKGDKAYTT